MATSAAIKAQKQAAKDQRDRDAESDRRAVHGTLRAIAAELSVLRGQALTHLRNLLDERAQTRRRSPNQIAPFAITQTDPNRFTVFESNCSVLGKIANDDLISHIVSLYSRAKEMVDYVNTTSRDFQRWRLLPDGDHEKEVIRRMLDDLEGGLRNGLPTVTRELDIVLAEIDEYLRALLIRATLWLRF